MHQHLKAILKLVAQMKCEYRLIPIACVKRFEVVETIIMRRIVQYRDIAKAKKAKEQHETQQHLIDFLRAGVHKHLGGEAHKRKQQRIENDNKHDEWLGLSFVVQQHLHIHAQENHKQRNATSHEKCHPQ